jgi:manganese/iron transport system permease protein
VLKGWSLMGDAISHAVLPGVVLAYIVGLPLGVGAFAAGMGCALSVGYLKENSRIKEDTVMGVVFAGLFGLGIVLYTSIQTDVHLDHILFGDILGVSTGDLIQTGIIALVVTLIVLAKWRDLLLFTFDPQQAGAIGLPVRVLHYGLLALLSLTIVVIALLVAPGAIAYLISKRFAPMMLIAVTVSVLSSIVGIYASFFIDSAPAPTIVLLMSGTFIVTFIVTTTRRPPVVAVA